MGTPHLRLDVTFVTDVIKTFVHWHCAYFDGRIPLQMNVHHATFVSLSVAVRSRRR